MAASKDHATLLLSPAGDLQDISSRDLTTMASSARRYVGEEEQLANSCLSMSAIAKPIKWAMADSIILPSPAKDLQARRYKGEDKQLTTSCYITIKPSKWAIARDSTINVQRSAKYSLHQEVDRSIMCVGTPSMYFKMCPTAFSRESMAEYSTYENSFSEQHHTYTSKQCRVVDKEVSIDMALLHSCSWDKSMQLQNVFSVVGI